MIEYEGMSDYHINKAIGLMLGVVKGGKVSGYYMRACPDYCNNPSDMWPIMVANKIKTGWHRGEDWMAQVDNQFQAGAYKRFVYCHTNPLRAAAIVFLKMMESKK